MRDTKTLDDIREQPARLRHLAEKSRRPPLTPVQVLLACGWLTSADAEDSRLRVETLTRSHQVVRVTAPDRRVAIVKQSIHAQGHPRDLARELYVYRLAAWIGALAEVLPATLHLDEQRGLLVLESLAVGRNWPDDSDLVPLTSPGIARRLGRAMASWHRETKDIPMAPSLAAGILHLPDSLETAIDGRSASAQNFMRSVAVDREFAEALQAGASIYRHACLIHGDVRPDNWLVRRETAQPTLKVIDWEMSGFGDPAWDFGSACAESILQAIRSGVVLPRETSGWPEVAEPTLRELLDGYLTTGGGLAREEAEWERVVLYTGCRLLHVACEWAEYRHNVDDGLVDQIASQARGLLRARRPASASLARWSGA
jgi:thiamine kinase-like enzyme